MKSLSVQVTNQIYNDRFIAVDIVEIHLKNQQGQNAPLYLTNANFDILWLSPTAPTGAGQAVRYTAQGEFLGFTTVSEEIDIKVGRFNIFLSAISNDYLTKFTATEIESKRVVIYKVFLDYNTLAVLPNPVMMFDGVIMNAAITESAVTCSISVDCATLFSDFERTNGRMTNNNSNWLFQGNTLDRAFEKSGWTGNTEIAWGRTK